MNSAGKTALYDDIFNPANLTDAIMEMLQIDAENRDVKLEIKCRKQGIF